MAKALRHTEPNIVHLITTRTRKARIWMVPSPEMNSLLGGVVAKYKNKYDIPIYSYGFLGNHYHILCECLKEGLLSKFAENINREIAKRVNHFHGLDREEGYYWGEGKFWGRRYDDQVVIKEVDELEGFLYVNTNPTKHGLVSHPNDWPGLISYKQALSEKEHTHYFMNWTEYSEARKRSNKSGETIRKADYEEPYPLSLTPLKMFSELSKKERTEKLHTLLEERTKQLQDERKREGKWFLGRKKVLQQIPGTIPREVSRSPRPKCYSKDLEAKREYAEQEKERRNLYTQASIRFRSGDYNVEFPPFCFKPPSHRKPKEYQFTPT